ncbi:MAG: hypothetical protein GTN40_01555 [Candidatus Aenigmarchaeota archaeon]|nr:hypothetical protein [Candidatus Aenigmarchaeota archaeon]
MAFKTLEELKNGTKIKTKKIPRCRDCGSTNIYGISRVVGYFSRIENWNKSKRAEFTDRQKGNYNLS